MFMHRDSHSPPALPFPQSTMRQKQMLASLPHRGEGLGEGVSRRETSKVWVSPT